MPIRETIELAVNAFLVIGFIMLMLGVGLWLFNLSREFYLSIELMLIIFGCVLVVFGILAAKIFTKVGN